MRATLTAMAILVMCVAVRAADDDAKKDQDQMQGEWSLVSGMRNGEPLPEDAVKTLKRKVEGNASTVTRDGEVVAKATFTLDASKKPKTIDITVEGQDKPVLGIYEVDADKMKICYGGPGDERPKEFASKENSGITLAVWKREKK
jgi:uncharacterized protein (TIGR03067 family)